MSRPETPDTCPNCQTTIDADESTCPQCGAAVDILDSRGDSDV